MPLFRGIVQAFEKLGIPAYGVTQLLDLLERDTRRFRKLGYSSMELRVRPGHTLPIRTNIDGLYAGAQRFPVIHELLTLSDAHIYIRAIERMLLNPPDLISGNTD